MIFFSSQFLNIFHFRSVRFVCGDGRKFKKNVEAVRKCGKKRGDRMKASKRDDTMMAVKKDKRCVVFQKISWVGRRMDVKISVFHSSSANFDPEKGSNYLLLLLSNFVDLLVNCSV